MAVPVLTFFNNKGGVGKTSLIYHLAWMLSETGHRVLACDLDPQANLTAMFLEEDRLETIYEDGDGASSPAGTNPSVRETADASWRFAIPEPSGDHR